jgi:hypothetical protein
MASKPHYIPEKLIIPLIQAGIEREPALPDVPLLLDQKVPEGDRPLLEFMSQASTVGRPLATSPGTPPERVAALRRAFEEMLVDPLFIADAKKVGADIKPMSGEKLSTIINAMIGAPSDARERVKLAIEPKEADVVK